MYTMRLAWSAVTVVFHNKLNKSAKNECSHHLREQLFMCCFSSSLLLIQASPPPLAIFFPRECGRAWE